MIEIIRNRLNSYQATNPIMEENASKEILQEIALYALWRADFYKIAAFQGGTSLRILHGLPRFSEDLDFILKQADNTFKWSKYLNKVLVCFEEFGLKSEAIPKGRIDSRIKKAIIKDNSLINQLNLSFYGNNSKQKLKIKVEIDINPPVGSAYQYSYLDFPLDFEICHQDLSSNFALKIHALLCRKYLKGRDWYDFNWYVKQNISPNLNLLKNALIQYGPWQGKYDLEVDLIWLQSTLNQKIKTVDWKVAVNDVNRFISKAEQYSLSLWSLEFFSNKVESLV